MSIGEGEIVALLGRNGVGRSTTCKAVMGEVPPQGSVVFKGREIAGMKPFEVAKLGIGYVPENRDIFPGLTTRQNLILGLKPGQKDGAGTLVDGGHVQPLLQPPRAGGCGGERAVGRRAADADHVPDPDGRPGFRDDRRADRGSLAPDDPARRRHVAGDRAPRRGHPAGRTEVGHRPRHRATASMSWAMARWCSKGRRTSSASATTSARSGWRSDAPPSADGARPISRASPSDSRPGHRTRGGCR